MSREEKETARFKILKLRTFTTKLFLFYSFSCALWTKKKWKAETRKLTRLLFYHRLVFFVTGHKKPN
tara:strand:- start:4892 stop:5092 length:201 start_codon:yes stop_codon:yes gene_type:complete